MIEFRVLFNTMTGRVAYSDLTSHLTVYGLLPDGNLQITYPDGIVQSFGNILNNGNLYSKEYDFRVDAFGELMTGSYRFLYRLYDGTTLIGTFDETIDISFEEIELTVVNSSNAMIPFLRLTDGSDYTLAGWDVLDLGRTWVVTRGSAEYFSGDPYAKDSYVDLYNAGYFSGTYSYLFVAEASYVKSFVTIILKYEASGEEVITKPTMIPEILALLNCLYGKISAKDCCKDAAYDTMLADYQLAISLMYNFVSNGQAGITSGQADLLAKILVIVKRYGCGDDGTIADELLSGYDWCLCDTGSGTGEGRFNYSAGNGAMVTSTVDNDVTFVKSAGVGTFTAATGHLIGGTITGTAGDATYDSNGATNSFKVVFPVKDASLAYASMLCALCQVWDATNSGNITDVFPLVMDEGAVQKRVVDIGSNTVSIVFAGIGAVYSGGWMITF